MEGQQELPQPKKSVISNTIQLISFLEIHMMKIMKNPVDTIKSNSKINEIPPFIHPSFFPEN